MSQRCPVPAEQQPLNEYQDVRESWFYSWGSRDLTGYLKPLIILWLVGWGVAGPMAAASFAPAKHPLPFGLSGALGAMVLPMLTLLQLYVGWAHVGGRLRQTTVPYEESGWYDGQLWVKPEEVSNRDRLIVDYEVQPVLQRIRRTLGVMALLLAGGLIAWPLV
ncbi:CGLD27 family protein [Leptolyngbya sp. CCNP1308]|uniref:CGLD27 family protein n=1 Tax=Leptolyngbya sp. CCNP1308 TaxID=3110255 RepID=UPI002B213CD1|nr:CGLD27 family protein [Leptolyngbya sp. CCNP1308]MEA5448887.1 CGLD27 family protein [Leptolyngbya sp. CCNP1308]